MVASILLFCPTARSQSAPETEEDKAPWLELAFEQRTRYEHLTNPFRLEEFGVERFLPLRTRLRLEIREILDPLRFTFEFQDARAFYDEGSVFLTPRHINKHDILQLNLQLVSSDFLGIGQPTELQVGRFNLNLGKRRLYARNIMRNTTNAFDGLHWTIGTDSNWRLRAFVAKPVRIEPEKPDSSDKNRWVWGAFFQSRSRPSVQVDAYYFGLHENEQSLTQRRFTTLGGRLFKSPTAGAFDYEVESALQFGNQADLDLLAYFQHAEIGYVFDDGWTPRLAFQYDYASGDRSPDDETWGRFNTLFGARRFDFNPTGIYGPFFRGNLNTPGIRLVMMPADRFEIVAVHRAFWLAQSRDSWVGSGLRDPTGGSGSSLGHQFEVCFRWKAVTFALIELGCAHFFKGSYLDRVPGSPQTPDSNYFYASIEIRARFLKR